MNKIVKQLFSLQAMKIAIFARAQMTLEDRLAHIEYKFIDSTLNINFLLFDAKHKREDGRKDLLLKVNELLDRYCPDVKREVKFVILDQRNEKKYAKYYFLIFKKKYLRFGTNPLSTLNKLDTLVLHPQLDGLLVKVKGKRGARTDVKTFIKGRVLRHSSKPGQLYTYKGQVQTPLGVMGVNVTVMKKTDLPMLPPQDLKTPEPLSTGKKESKINRYLSFRGKRNE